MQQKKWVKMQSFSFLFLFSFSLSPLFFFLFFFFLLLLFRFFPFLFPFPALSFLLWRMLRVPYLKRKSPSAMEGFILCFIIFRLPNSNKEWVGANAPMHLGPLCFPGLSSPVINPLLPFPFFFEKKRGEKQTGVRKGTKGRRKRGSKKAKVGFLRIWIWHYFKWKKTQ